MYLSTEKDDIQKENDLLKSEINLLKDDKIKILREMDNIKEIAKNESRLREENESSRNEIQNLENQQNLLKSEKNKTEKELMKKVNDLRTIMNENNSHKSDVKILKKQVSENLAEIDFLKSKLKEKDIILIEKEKEADIYSRRKYDNAIYDSENRNRENSYLKQITDELKNERDSLIYKLSSKDKLISDLENDLAKLRNDDENNDSVINQLKDKISDVS